MSDSEWVVHSGDKRIPLTVTSHGIQLGEAGGGTQFSWSDLSEVAFPSAFSARFLPHQGEPIQVGFADRAQQAQFRTLYANTSGHPEVPLPRARLAEMPLTTIDSVPGRVVLEAVGMVTAHRVMSRNWISDLGSDLKSNWGGNLVGVEKAIAQSLAEARSQMVAAARAMGADAVVGVRVELASVAEKAEAILMTGTAVRTAPAPARETNNGTPPV